MIWNVCDNDTSLTSIVFTSLSYRQISQMLGKSVINAQVTYSNFTAVASTLTITNFSASSANAVACNDLRNVITTHDAFPSKLSLVLYVVFGKVILCHHTFSYIGTINTSLA